MSTNWIATLSGAAMTTLVSNLLYIVLINLACFAVAVFVTWLYRRRHLKLTVYDGVCIGALTGVCSGVLGLALIILGMAEGIQGIGSIPVWVLLVFNLFGLFLTVIVGTIGGLIGWWAIFRTDHKVFKAVRSV